MSRTKIGVTPKGFTCENGIYYLHFKNGAQINVHPDRIKKYVKSEERDLYDYFRKRLFVDPNGEMYEDWGGYLDLRQLIREFGCEMFAESFLEFYNYKV